MKTIRNLSIAATIITILAAIMGSYVRGMGAGLACPDWPLCYGELVPVLEGLVFLEWFHRMVVLVLSLIIFSIAFVSWKKELPEKKLAYGIVGLLIVQAVLGGLTVLMKLNVYIVALHQGFALIFFALLVVLTTKSYLAVSPTNTKTA